MHSALVRAQNVFGFFTTVAFVIAGLIAASDYISPRTPSASISVGNVQVQRGRPHYYSTKREEYASIKFNLDADLTSLFTWNTKQIFVWVTAGWPDGTVGDHMNEAVIWDQIITAPSSDHLSNIAPAALKKLRKSSEGKAIDKSRGVLKLRNQKPKYQITAPSGKLASAQNVTLKFEYNVQPWVGVLDWPSKMDFGAWKRMKGGASKAFDLPAIKKKEESTKNPSAT